MNTDQIKALMIEAGRAGDWLTVSLCEVALGERGWTTIDGRRYGQRLRSRPDAPILTAGRTDLHDHRDHRDHRDNRDHRDAPD